MLISLVFVSISAVIIIKMLSLSHCVAFPRVANYRVGITRFYSASIVTLKGMEEDLNPAIRAKNVVIPMDK